jgi:hypothetical protein
MGRATVRLETGMHNDTFPRQISDVVHVAFVDEKGLAQSTELLIIDPGAGNTRSWMAKIIVALLASHPADIDSAIASGRVAGWEPIAVSTPDENARLGYAITLAAAP